MPDPKSKNRQGIVIGVALVLRTALVSFALVHFGPAWFFSRGSEMGLLADALLHGAGLSSPFGVPTGPTAIVAPGYPLLVSGVFRAFGSYTQASALCLMLLNAACNCATVAFIYRLGRQIATESMAFAAALFWACSLPLLWMPTIFWETSISTMLLIGMISVMQSVRPNGSVALWWLCGGVLGLAGLLNPALLLSLFAVVGYTFVQTAAPSKSGQNLAACVAGFVLVYSPWPLRNATTFHACVLTRTTVGLELWMGNRPGATGFLEPSIFPTYNKAELAEYRQVGELGYMAHKGQLAHAFIQAHPIEFLRLSGQRAFRFWTGTGTRHGSSLFGLHAAISSLLGCSGLYLLWRDGQKEICLAIALPLVLFPLPYYITHAEFRYRLVLDPVLMALGAKCLDTLMARLRKTREKAAIHHAPVLTA
ncbi:MAG: hypothetical protein ACRYFU_09150 [Janthinobacterium lividum]